jgi:hypothetical protein
MIELERMIKDAEIMLRSADPEQRERGKEKLREVVRDGEGSTSARQAHHLLSLSDSSPSEPLDPELDELMMVWPSIQGFNDYRLVSFLKRLQAYPGIAVPLRTDVIRELRQWITDELLHLGQGAKIGALNEFVASVRGVAAYEVLPEFGQLCDALFSLRLQETAVLVDEALELWEPDRAWRLMDELPPLPEAFKTKVERLQADIYEVDRLRRNVDGLLRQLRPVAPTNWFDTRLQAALLQQVIQHLSTGHRPQEWHQRLTEARTTLTSFVEQFVRGQAIAAVTIRQLREFWMEYDRLTGEQTLLSLPIGEDWFANGLESLAAEVGRDVARARNNNELTAIANRLRADMEGVPPLVATRIGEFVDTIEQDISSWRAMQDGQDFELPSAETGELPVPRAWPEEALQYANWIRQIETAFNTFKNETPAPSEQDYEDGQRLAEEILRQVPNHALARKLQLEAIRRISCYQLDEAMSEWKLESFFKLVGLNNPGEIYAALAVDRQPLLDLRNLAQRSSLTDWRTAAEWWTAWQVGMNLLPSAKPDALLRALDLQTDKRKKEWYATLGSLLEDNVAWEEYEAAAASLANEPDSNLQTYQQELRHKETTGRIKQLIKSKRFEDAELELGKLPATSSDAVELRTQLMYGQALSRSSVAAAEFVSSEWYNVRYLGEPRELLLDSIQAVWAEDAQESLAKLSQLLSRVLSKDDDADTVNETTHQLAEWQTWLEIEDGLIRNFSSGGVKQLADYLRTAKASALLDQRLNKLLRHWQQENNNVLLAWAYQAFKPKSSLAEQFDHAADLLVSESQQIAQEVRTVLAERSAIALEDLPPLHEAIKREEEKWQSLDDYLGLYLAHNVNHRKPPPQFAAAKTNLSEVTRILTLLAQLNEADLRQDAMLQAFKDADSRSRRLQNVASRERILAELDRLRPLTDLPQGERIRETAERCSSRDPLDVLESSLFERLANYVREVDEIFEAAAARGGAMWQLVSADYEQLIYREACVLLPLSNLPQLDSLANTLDSLNAEDLEFIKAIELLEDRDGQPKVLSVGTFYPEPHLDYLRLIPSRAPQSLKVYYRFDRARRDTLKIILEAPASRPHLPVWVRDYLDKGVPACGNAG